MVCFLVAFIGMLASPVAFWGGVYYAGRRD